MSEFNNDFEKMNIDATRYRRDKKMFSRVGFALLAVWFIDFALELGASLAFRRFFPAIYANRYFAVCCQIVCNYLIATPIGLLILNTVTKPLAERENKKLGAKNALFSFSACVAAMFVGSQLGSMVNSLVASLLGRGSYSSVGELMNSIPLWGSFALVVVIGPIFEELLFRRGVTEALRPWGWKKAVLLSGLFFGLFHGNLEQFFYAAFIGMVLGYVYLYTGKVRYTAVLHMAINFVGGFIPVLINRFAYSAVAIQQFENAMNEYSAAVEAAATPADIPAQVMQSLVAAMAKVLPGTMFSMLYDGLIMGLAVSGIIVFLRFNRKLSFQAPERTIEGRYLGDTVFLSPGVLLFALAMISFMLLGVVFR
jgi:membrane protease YdiL (CAAX protease family)